MKNLYLMSLLVCSITFAQDITNNCNQVRVNTNLQMKVNGSFTNATSAILQNNGNIVISNNFTNAGNVQGKGTIQFSGTNTNTGVVEPGIADAGTLNVTGNYNNGSSGTLNLEIGGNLTTDYDQLLVNGTFTCNGTLNVSFINSYLPTSGSFDLVTATNVTGTFTNVNLPAGWNIQYNATNVRIFYGTLSANSENFIAQLQVYPNPFKEEILIDAPQKANIEVINMLGKVVFRDNIQQGVSKISLNTLQVGAYFLRVSNEDAQLRIIKIIKQ